MRIIRSAAAAITFFILSGCSDSTNNWGESEITMWLDEHWGLNEIEMTEEADGTFAGTGKIWNGELIRFAVEKKTFDEEIHFIQLDEEGAWLRSSVFKKY